MEGQSIRPDLKRYVENFYSPLPKDDSEKMAVGLIDLAAVGADGRRSIKTFFEQVVRYVFRQFGFSEVAIGLKDRKEDVWKYEAAFGFTKDVEAKLFRARYDRADMYGQERFPNIKTGKLSELNVAEGLPVEDTEMYDRPYRFRAKRTSVEEFHQGDFMDFWMFDEKREIVGWIEVSSPKDKKQPSRATVRWIEFLASLCAQMVLLRWEEDQLRSKKASSPGPPVENADMPSG